MKYSFIAGIFTARAMTAKIKRERMGLSIVLNRHEKDSERAWSRMSMVDGRTLIFEALRQ